MKTTRKFLLAAITMSLGAATALGCSAQVEVNTPPKPKPAVEETPAEPAPAPEYLSIDDRIQFETGRATLLDSSTATLDQIVQTLRDNAHITQVEIEGHTDAAGLVDMNLRLSQRRAEAVRSYLVEQGIDEARLLPVGYGQEKPIADNDTFEGREQNRRVEFRILRRGDG